jgi:hypothetical protein
MLRRMFLLGTVFVGMLAIGVGCDAGGTQKVSSFQQSECKKNEQGLPLLPRSPEEAEVSAKVSGSYVEVMYKLAPFRCAQKVGFFVEEKEGEIHVVARPNDMDPDVVAACDCTYDYNGKIGPLAAGKYTVKIYHQGDNKSGQEKKQVASVELEITDAS